MEGTITILKRSNGCYGIYVNGNKQENLQCNSFLTDRVDFLINRIMMEQVKYPNAKIIFTDKEEDFKSELPTLEEYLCGK